LDWLREVDLRPLLPGACRALSADPRRERPAESVPRRRLPRWTIWPTRLEVFAGAGHAPFLANPERFSDCWTISVMPLLPAKPRVRESFERAAASYDGAAVLQRQVCDRLLADFSSLSRTGKHRRRRLRHRLRRPPAARALAGRCARSPRSTSPRPCSPSRAALPISAWLPTSRRCPARDECFSTWWSNLTVQWCDAGKVFAEARRVLRPGGQLALSTLGPDTFAELRAAFTGIDRTATP
jgi:SAM-dependent methyltransferase